MSFGYFKSILRFFFTFDFAYIITVYNDYSDAAFIVSFFKKKKTNKTTTARKDLIYF